MPSPLSENIASVTEDPNLEQIIQKDIQLNQLNFAIDQLNDEQKLCVTLFYLKKQTYQQIAELMQVKSFIQNGKRNLKMKLLKMQENE